MLQPQVSVITNLDKEHLDYYRDLDHIKETFAHYLRQLPPGARVAAWKDDPHLQPILKDTSFELLTYSLNPGADLLATAVKPQGLGTGFRLTYRGQELGPFSLPLAGAHYVLNAMAACAVGLSLGLDVEVWRQGLKDLGLIHRRCQVKGEARGVLVLDDYGHHPAEIAATLTGLSQAFPSRRLVVVFQPHRYTRTRALLPEFFPVFARAGLVFVTEIYSAGEPRVDGLSGRAIYEGIRQSGHRSVYFLEETRPLTDSLMNHLLQGDLVLTLGAGDIWKTGEDLLARLAETSGDHTGRRP